MAVRSADAVRPRGALRPTTTELVAGGGVAALLLAGALSPRHVEDGPVLCPFRRLTGLPCPGCGLTRSWVYLVHGWWREALTANPFGVVAVLAVLALAVAVVLARVRRTSPPDLDDLVRRPWAIALVAAWLTFAAVRIGVELALR